MKEFTLLFTLLLTSHLLNAQNRENESQTQKERHLKEYQILQQEENYLQQLHEKSNLKSFKVAANEQDSLALVAIYNSTGGDNWTNNTGWLTDSVANWFGITLNESGRVLEIIIYSNNLKGTIPKEIGDLEIITDIDFFGNFLYGQVPIEMGNLINLDWLMLGKNQLTGIIPVEFRLLSKLRNLSVSNNNFTEFPSLSPLYKKNIWAHTNKFTFEDIEHNLAIASYFEYSPQAKVGQIENHFVEIGQTDTLIVSVGGEHNVYQWYKDGTLVSGANNDSLIIENFSSTDTGSYYCKI
ncbi:MAG: hypothetical protein DRJ10_03225, partial [Bacteroidetes bacterium]